MFKFTRPKKNTCTRSTNVRFTTQHWPKLSHAGPGPSLLSSFMKALNLWEHNVECSSLWDVASVLITYTSTHLVSPWKENTTAGDNSAVCVMAPQSFGTRLLSTGTSRDLDGAHHKWGHSPTSQHHSLPKPNTQTLKPLLTCIRLHGLPLTPGPHVTQ